jgi:hypothetical protein
MHGGFHGPVRGNAPVQSAAILRANQMYRITQNHAGKSLSFLVRLLALHQYRVIMAV